MTVKENLSVLDAIYNVINKFGIPKIKKTAFICVQHLLHTSVDLFDILMKWGAAPENIFVIGKHYSTSEIVVEKIRSRGIQLQTLTPLKNLGEYTEVFNQDVSTMWQKVQCHLSKKQRDIDAVVVLDDGGRCLEFIKKGILHEWAVIGIEQTTAGLFNPAVLDLHVPFIDVATSAGKVHLEADLIVDVILEKIMDVLPANKNALRCGVIGTGVIGQSVVKKLLSMEATVFTYDKNKKQHAHMDQVFCCESAEEVIKNSAYLFGCTGRDITESLNLSEIINEDKIFISCTSEDKEFLSLLKIIQQKQASEPIVDPLSDIVWEMKSGKFIKIIKGGFPVNFDHSGTCVPAQKIQLTRGLLLASLIQAIVMLPSLTQANAKGRIMLYPESQKFVTQAWLKTHAANHLPVALTEKFNNIDWIIRHSGGMFYPSEYLDIYFSQRTYLPKIPIDFSVLTPECQEKVE